MRHRELQATISTASNPDILNEYADTFDLNINLVTIQDFGGWDEVQKKHFDDGGVFDRIYEKTDK